MSAEVNFLWVGVGPHDLCRMVRGSRRGRVEGGVLSSGHILNCEGGLAYFRNACGINLQVESG